MKMNPMSLNWIESAIDFVSPSTALKRARMRAVRSEMERAYDAAGRGRRTDGWRATGSSANVETARSLDMLRNRSRDITRNNPYGRRAIHAISTNTIGTGIRPRPIGTDKNLDKVIKKAWNEWANKTVCDFDGQGNLYSLQGLIMTCVAESGECLVRRKIVKTKKGKGIPLQLQVLEPDFLDHTKNTGIKDGKESYTIQGVEFNSQGKRIGYWLYPVHPGEGMVSQSQLVPASEVLHIYVKERPGQVRGVPASTASMMSLRDFDEYEQAQLIRQKIAACFAVFVTDATSDTATNVDSKDQQVEKVEPGMIEHLSPGKSVTFSTPPSLSNYGEYSTSMLRKIAAGFGVSYEILSGDYSKVNFSSGRMGWIEFGRLIAAWQDLMLVPMMCDPIWEWFLEAALIAGKIPTDEVAADWTMPRRHMIDPAKEIKAMSESIRAGLSSWQDAIRESGRDPDVVLEELIQDQEKFTQNKIILTSSPKDDADRIKKQDSKSTNTK